MIPPFSAGNGEIPPDDFGRRFCSFPYEKLLLTGRYRMSLNAGLVPGAGIEPARL